MAGSEEYGIIQPRAEDDRITRSFMRPHQANRDLAAAIHDLAPALDSGDDALYEIAVNTIARVLVESPEQQDLIK
jgi:hypothetical protein